VTAPRPGRSALRGGLAAFALAGTLADPGAAGRLRVGILTDPLSLDPHQATDVVSVAIVANVCETLVRFDSIHPAPTLATSWATLDGRSWTLTLRQGVRFHDGQPFDADAVVANLERLRQVRSFPGRAERVGPHVVAIHLERPNAALLATLSQPFYALQSPSSLGSERPVGTGPFRLALSRPGSYELVANPDYWGGAPRLAQVSLRRLPSQQALVSALLAGEIDIAPSVAQEQVARLHQSTEINLESQTGFNIAFLSLNNERAPFSDRRVRQAVARAIDRDALVTRILGGHGMPARNPIPPSLFGYGASTKELILDRPAVRRLLAEAGWPSGFDATLLAVDSPRPYLPAPLRLAAQLKDDLAQVGIRVTIQQVPSWAEYVERGNRGRFDMMLHGWQADTGDPNDFLSALVASEAIGTTNRSRYRSPEMDNLLKRGRMGTDVEERLAAYREAQELFQRDMPWVPLYHVAVFTASRRPVRGLSLGLTGVIRFDKVWKAE
jgi:peptide/nickel transport system substrate-binding protein